MTGGIAVFDAGVLVGISLCIALAACSIAIDWLMRRYGRYISKELLPAKIDPTAARCADDAAYIEGWNDCLDVITNGAGGEE